MHVPQYIQAPILAAIAMASIAPSALAASAPDTRLISCRSGSCLLVTGHRDDASSAVRINGHVVPVTGKRNWRVTLPVARVRELSASFARTITITLNADTPHETMTPVDLPIGLLGHTENLAFLVVSAR